MDMVSPYRLRKNRDVERVFRIGKPLFSVFLGCRYVVASEDSLAAFSVSKKRFPTAVERNRMKRRLRESFRMYQRETLAPKGKYVFFFTKQSKNPSFQDVREAMRAILGKIR